MVGAHISAFQRLPTLTVDAMLQASALADEPAEIDSGDVRPSSPFEKTHPDGWLAAYAEGLLNMLSALGRLAALSCGSPICWTA